MDNSGNYCEKCGESLVCPICHGTGELGSSVSSALCCSKSRTTDYCPACGRYLGYIYSKKSKCILCSGTGETSFHTCSSD